MIRIKRKIYYLRLALTFIYLGLCYSETRAQHVDDLKTLDTLSIYKWPHAETAHITGDGKYAGYMVNEGYGGPGELVLEKLASSWSYKISEIVDYQFTKANQAVALDSHNNLNIIKLNTDEKRIIEGINSFKIFTNRATEWLVYTTVKNELVFINLKSEKKYIYLNVINWYHDKNYNSIVLITKEGISLQLSYIDMKTIKQSTIASYDSINSIVIDDNGQQIAFISESSPLKSNDKAIWYYSTTTKQAKVILSNEAISTQTERFTIAGIERFNLNGSHLFIQISEVPIKKREKRVTIWSYQDDILQSQQRKELSTKTLLSSINISTNKYTQIQNSNELIEFISSSNDNLIKIDVLEASLTEDHWNKKAKRIHFIYNLKTGKRTKTNLFITGISPDSKYLIGLDSSYKELMIYDVSKNANYDLTKNLTTQENDKRFAAYDLRGWMFGEWIDNSHMIFYDEHDIWVCEPGSSKATVNVTNGYGKRNDLVLSLTTDPENETVKLKKDYVLTAFNKKSKQNGFYKSQLILSQDPGKLIMSDDLYASPKQLLIGGMAPVKSENANVWIIRKERVDASPNYFITTDFKIYKQISEIYPEQKYDWIKAQLIDFKNIDGTMNQGILYLPKNFDPSKKYPVIINYYEGLSNRLNLYIRPALTTDNINIPWFVNRDYIVFTPDIKYTVTEPGESAVNSVVGAYKYLSSLPYIDSSRVGIDGQSFGGYETNYIVTHSNVFAAALSTGGFADLISAIGSPRPTGGYNFFDSWAISGQGRLTYSLWERPDLYIKNSPIFQADKATTPLLMMNNENDGIVNVSQGVEFFIALRRLGKKAWMLQYDQGRHVLYQKEDALDFTSRIEQFYGHYLKGQPMPDWMGDHSVIKN